MLLCSDNTTIYKSLLLYKLCKKNLFKTDGIRKLGEVDITSLVNLLSELENEWDKETDFKLNPNKDRKEGSLAQVKHINFAWSKLFKEEDVYVKLPLWTKYKDVLLPILKKATEPYGYKNGFFPKIMLANMLPGANIPLHTDGFKRLFIPHKIHIPLQTNEKTFFILNGEKHHFKRGVAYEVNNALSHGGKNLGETERIHLIFEYLDADINIVPSIDIQH